MVGTNTEMAVGRQRHRGHVLDESKLLMLVFFQSNREQRT